MEKLAILIPVHNALEYTEKALSNLKQFIGVSLWELKKSIEIIVIDDGSTDGSGDWIKLNFPEVIILSGDGQLWWSGAVNMGSKYAFENLDCSYVLLWNNDITADNDYFINLYEVLQGGMIIPIIGSKVYITGGNLIWSMGGTFKPFSGAKSMIGFKQEDNPDFNMIVSADWITGMGTVVHKSVVDKIGYWDAINFPQYHGDSDFTFRAKKAGFSLLIYPNLKIWNSIENTGLQHSRTIQSLLNSLQSIKSDFNFKKDFLFYYKHSIFFVAYFSLLWKYFRYIGGFFKQKLLSVVINK